MNERDVVRLVADAAVATVFVQDQLNAARRRNDQRAVQFWEALRLDVVRESERCARDIIAIAGAV